MNGSLCLLQNPEGVMVRSTQVILCDHFGRDDRLHKNGNAVESDSTFAFNCKVLDSEMATEEALPLSLVVAQSCLSRLTVLLSGLWPIGFD